MKINLLFKELNINRSVLQDSFLSPMTFNIYIIDIIDILDKK